MIVDDDDAEEKMPHTLRALGNNPLVQPLDQAGPHEVKGTMDNTKLLMDTRQEFPQSLPYADDIMRVDFKVDFPISVSQIIIDNSAVLADYVCSLKGSYHFEAGFDVIPPYCTLGFTEQSYCFQGAQILSDANALRYKRDAVDD
jgi:hypothetical protein